MDIPFDLLYIVASFYTKPKMKLLDWIPEDKLKWDVLSENSNAIHLLEQNLDNINWEYLSYNPNAIHILEKHMDEIDWDWLTRNSNAIHLLEKHPEKIKWGWLSQNPSIFEIDTLQTNLELTTKAKNIDYV